MFAYFEFVSCRYLRAALSRAFTAWSANHPYIKFIDKSAECDAANSTWDELSTSCPGVELLIDTTTEDAKQNRTNEAVAHIEYTSARGVPRSPNGQEHTSTRTADGQTEITDFARIKFSARPCWYLDTTFCASFHAAEVGGGSETVLTAGKAVDTVDKVNKDIKEEQAPTKVLKEAFDGAVEIGKAVTDKDFMKKNQIKFQADAALTFKAKMNLAIPVTDPSPSPSYSPPPARLPLPLR